MPFIELPPEGEAFPHRASRAQLVALLNSAMPPHIWTYCLIRLNTGCRGDAALDLQPEQVDFDIGMIRLNPPGAGRPRSVALSCLLRARSPPISQRITPPTTPAGMA